MKYLKVLSIFALCIIFAAGCRKGPTEKNEQHFPNTVNKKLSTKNKKTKSGSIENVASSNPDLTIFAKAMRVSGVANLLNIKSSFTVFAPSNKAFKNLPAGELKKLMSPSGKKELANILKYHIVGSIRTTKDLKKRALPGGQHNRKAPSRFVLSTLEGGKITISLKKDQIYVDSAEIVVKNIKARNGMIQVINEVLMPPKK
jgi:uncharacterized surface protein with fasciclin (FAS1) repeats